MCRTTIVLPLLAHIVHGRRVQPQVEVSSNNQMMAGNTTSAPSIPLQPPSKHLSSKLLSYYEPVLKNLREAITNMDASDSEMGFAVVLSAGAYNPAHRGHLDSLRRAVSFLNDNSVNIHKLSSKGSEAKNQSIPLKVIGSYMVPSAEAYVRSKKPKLLYSNAERLAILVQVIESMEGRLGYVGAYNGELRGEIANASSIADDSSTILTPILTPTYCDSQSPKLMVYDDMFLCAMKVLRQELEHAVEDVATFWPPGVSTSWILQRLYFFFQCGTDYADRFSQDKNEVRDLINEVLDNSKAIVMTDRKKHPICPGCDEDTKKEKRKQLLKYVLKSDLDPEVVVSSTMVRRALLKSVESHLPETLENYPKAMEDVGKLSILMGNLAAATAARSFNAATDRAEKINLGSKNDTEKASRGRSPATFPRMGLLLLSIFQYLH